MSFNYNANGNTYAALHRRVAASEVLDATGLDPDKYHVEAIYFGKMPGERYALALGLHSPKVDVTDSNFIRFEALESRAPTVEHLPEAPTDAGTAPVSPSDAPKAPEAPSDDTPPETPSEPPKKKRAPRRRRKAPAKKK